MSRNATCHLNSRTRCQNCHQDELDERERSGRSQWRKSQRCLDRGQMRPFNEVLLERTCVEVSNDCIGSSDGLADRSEGELRSVG